MKVADAYVVDEKDRMYLVPCPGCGHSTFRHLSYIKSMDAHRCPNCHELFAINTDTEETE